MGGVAGFPGDFVGVRIARMLGDELLEGPLHFRPPAGVVLAVGLRVIFDVHAVLDEVARVGLDDAGGVEAILTSVDDEHRLVAEVAGVDFAVVEFVVGEHHDVAVQGQEARVRRGVAHGDPVGSGAAVGNAGDDDSVFIHVVGALERIDNGGEVQDLIVGPPSGGVPGVGEDVDLFGVSGELADFTAASGLVIGATADAAVELEADLIFLGGVVGGGDVDGVEMLDVVGGAVLALDDSGFWAA